MDTLDIIRKAEKAGGIERRRAIEALLLRARDLNCQLNVGGGRAGGMNIRYGSIGYAVLDINTQGLVKLYVQPHPSKDAPEEYIQKLNDFIEETEHLKPKSFPINSYGHLDMKIEEINPKSLILFLEKAVTMIRQQYYAPHFEEHELGLLEMDL